MIGSFLLSFRPTKNFWSFSVDESILHTCVFNLVYQAYQSLRQHRPHYQFSIFVVSADVLLESVFPLFLSPVTIRQYVYTVLYFV